MLARTRHAAAAFVVATAVIAAQSPNEFEVISIRPAADQPPDRAALGLHVSGSQVRLTHMSIKDYVALAYNVQAQQVVGPDWIDQQRFDFAAKLPDGSSSSEVPAMMQAMLAARFEMKLHHESRQLPVYALSIAKGGLKLQAAAPSETPASTGTRNVEAGGSANGVAVDLGGGASFTLVPNHVEIRKITLETLARTLTRFSDRPVVDETGGGAAIYDMTLELSPDEYTATLLRSAVNAGVNLPPPALRLLDGAASNPLAGALEKFGLSLESRRAPLDVVVVDSVRKTPIEN